MSHELRTPLNAIIGFSDMLVNEEQMRLDAARRKEYAQLINDSGSHLLSVVNGILDMSKMETGDFEITPEPFAPAPVISNCCDILALKARSAGIDLIVRNAAGLPDVVADKRAFKQIMLNLLSNAIKFSNRGGQITVVSRVEGARLMVSVEDNGIGIASTDLPRIGDPFFQARSAYDRRHDGTGLGLSIVKGLLDLHGGELKVSSELGKGTSISIYLPLDCETVTVLRKPEAASAQVEMAVAADNRRFVKVRKPTNRKTTAAKGATRASSGLFFQRKDIVAGALAFAAATAIVANAAFLQAGPHPAPMFAGKSAAPELAAKSIPKSIRVVGQEITGPAPLPMAAPKARPAEPELPKVEPAAPASARPRNEIMADIQRELSRRGFYDGSIDGVHGPKTDAAMRDFEQAAGLKPGSEPNDVFLRALTRSQAKASVSATAQPVRNDPIADLIAPSSKACSFGSARARRVWLWADQAERHIRSRNQGCDRAIRTRAQNACHRSDLSAPGAGIVRPDRPPNGIAAAAASCTRFAGRAISRKYQPSPSP